MVVAYQHNESGYYTYWKPESYSDYQSQERIGTSTFNEKTYPLANVISGYFNRVQNRQSTVGISLVSKNKIESFNL